MPGMGEASWIAEHWFDFIQTCGIIVGFLLTAYTLRKDEQARQVTNLVVANQQYREIWQQLYNKPGLFRVLKMDADLAVQPITDEEALFVRLLILHLHSVHRTMKVGMFVKLEGLQADVREFFSFPIPRAIWGRSKQLQDKNFVTFVEKCLNESPLGEESGRG